jgi:hypothetical protein
MRLHPHDIAAIAEAIAAKFVASPNGEEPLLHHSRSRYVDAAELAREIGMSPGWVYRNQKMLGAEPRGCGPKPRLRFDLERARAAVSSFPPPRPQVAPRRRRSRTRRTPAGFTPSGVPLLPVRGKD